VHPIRSSKRRRANVAAKTLARSVEALEERLVLSTSDLGALVDFSALEVDFKSYDDSKILVQLREGASTDDLSILGNTQLTASGSSSWGLFEVHLSNGVTVDDALKAYAQSPSVLYVEPDYRIGLTSTVVGNDPTLGSLWALNNTAQTGGTVDADIDAFEAWSTTTGSSSTLVAVIDTGIDYTHPDLAANIWVNAGEIVGNGIDDDGNGYVDDIHGYDFVNNDGDPMDDNGHGTHVAGTIGAVGNNGIGVAGVNWNVQIMGLKFLGADGSGYVSDAVRALDYAVDNGASVTNNSWGGGGYSQSLFDAIDRARSVGQIFVAAAGNAASNNDSTAAYPANYNLDNVISVAATDHNDNLASFSNYGASTVDLAAPGVSILSTTPGNNYATYSGTSMATPHVTGVIALLQSQHPEWSSTQIIDQILATVDPVASLQGKTITGGRLNAAAAVGPAGPDIAGPQVIASSPANTVSGTISSVRLTFNEAVDTSTFSAADIAAFTGPSGSISVSTVGVVAGSNGREFDVTFAPQSAFGSYTLLVGPNVSDSVGNLMNQDGDSINGESTQDQYLATFTITSRSIFSSTDVPKLIADGTTSNSVLTISQSLEIADLDVELDITHSWDSDLRIYLISPSGTQVSLVAFRGGSGDNFSGTLFDDEAAVPISAGAAPFAGSYRPEEMLSAFDAEDALGTWTLSIEDWYLADPGLLNSWSLSIESAVPDTSPQLADDTFGIAENAGAGTAVGIVNATDPDGGAMTYAILAGNSGDAFFIDPDTGEISVNSSSALDFESTPSFNLTVQVTDDEGLTDTGNVTINLADVSEAPLVANQSFDVSENSGSGTYIGTVAASDPDAGDSLSYAIIGGNQGTAFAIDAGTGQITVNNGSVIDFETYPTFVLTVQAIDDSGLSANANVTISLNDVNEAPSLSIGDRAMLHSQDTLVIDLAATDADGDPLTYSAGIVDSDPLVQLAYQLDQDLGLQANGTENWGGAGEKWFGSQSGTWYFMTPDGTLYQWTGAAAGANFVSGSQELASFDSSYHADPSKLYNAPAPSVSGSAAGNIVAVVGNELTVDPANGFVGTLSVQVTASDGVAATAETFIVSVINTAPSLSIGDQTMSHSQDTLVIDLVATDVDGDPLTYSAEILDSDPLAGLAYQLDQDLGLQANGTENWGGAGEKWFGSQSGAWYFITPDGTLYQWTGAAAGTNFVSGSQEIASFDGSYHADPSKLYNAPAPSVSGSAAGNIVAVVGNELTVDPANGFVGTLNVQVTASDGVASTSETFTVSVTDGSSTNVVSTASLVEEVGRTREVGDFSNQTVSDRVTNLLGMIARLHDGYWSDLAANRNDLDPFSENSGSSAQPWQQRNLADRDAVARSTTLDNHSTETLKESRYSSATAPQFDEIDRTFDGIAAASEEREDVSAEPAELTPEEMAELLAAFAAWR
jgi:subtilisin family serine protease/subtilisin-like proprotein convertase family protein